MTAITREVELGTQNRIVVPAEVKAALEVGPGDKLIFLVEDGRVTLTTRRAIVKGLRGAFAKPGSPSLVDELLAERRDEAARKGY